MHTFAPRQSVAVPPHSVSSSFEVFTHWPVTGSHSPTLQASFKPEQSTFAQAGFVTTQSEGSEFGWLEG